MRGTADDNEADRLNCYNSSLPIGWMWWFSADDSYIADLKAAGSVLLPMNGYWRAELQRNLFQIHLLNDQFEAAKLPLPHEFCLFADTSAEKAEITTIEMDEETRAYFACTYRISAGE